MTRRIPSFFAFLFLALFLGCNDTVVQEDGTKPEPVLRGTLRIIDSSRTLDSITWNWGGKKGKAYLACSEGICKFLAGLSSVGVNDTVECAFWTLGLRTMRGTARLDGSGDLSVVPKSLLIDSTAALLLSYHDSLRKLDEKKFPWTYGGLLEAYAMAILSRKTKITGGYPKSWPEGIDTTGLVRRMLELALDGQGSLEQIASSWSLPISASQAKPLVLDLLRERVLGVDDSLRLFPPSSLKFVKLVSLGGILWPDGDSVKFTGRVESDSALSRVSIQILRGETTVTDRFVVDTAPSVSGKSWDLDGKLAIRAKSQAEFGFYTMVIQVWNSQQSRILHTVPLKVEPRPDHQGPSLRFLKPLQADVIEPNDSVLSLQVRAEDPSGIDSVTIQSRRAKFGDDTARQEVSVPLKQSSFIFVVTAWDRAGNRTDSFLQLRRREVRDTLLFDLVEPAHQTGNALTVDSGVLRIKYKVRSPYGVSDTALRINRSLARRGPAPNDTDFWYQDVPVEADGNLVTIPVVLTDKRGGQISHFVEVRRSKDEKGPVLTWITPARDTTVEYGSPLVEIRVEVSDPSGVDSIRVQGRKPEPLTGNRFFALVGVPPDSGTDIHVQVWDGQGNLTDSVVRVSRMGSGQLLKLLRPGQQTGNIVDQQTTTFDVVWQLPRDTVKYTLSSPSKDELTEPGDGTVRLRAKALIPGERRWIKVCLESRDKKVCDSVSVVRDNQIDPPTIQFQGGLDSLPNGLLATSRDSADLAWKVLSKCEGCTYLVDGTGAVLENGLVRRNVPLKPGTSQHSLVVNANGTTLVRANFEIRRFQPPEIRLLSPADGLARADSRSVELEWQVTGGTRIWVEGVEQGAYVNGAFRATIARPEGDSKKVVIAVADSARGRKTDSVLVRWVVPVRFHIDEIAQGATRWDSVRFQINTPYLDAKFRWEGDQGRKGSAKPGDTLVLYSTSRLKVCASLQGFLDSCDSSEEISVSHTNQAPSFTRPPSSSRIEINEDAPRGELLLAQNLRKGGPWDSTQILRFEVRSRNRPGLYRDAPQVDLQSGVLSFVPAPDSSGSDTLEIKLCDNGGVEHGGKDCGSMETVPVLIRAVNDPPVGVPWSIQVPISEGLVRVPMDPISSGAGESADSSMKFQATWKSGNVKPSSTTIVRGATRDSVKLVPGPEAGGAEFEVVATESSVGKPAGGALTATFPLSVRVLNLWSVGESSVPLALGFGKTWMTRALGDSVSWEDAKSAKTACPSGWILPDSASIQGIKAGDTAVLARIGLAGGDRFWVKGASETLLAVVEPPSNGNRGVSFLAAADKKAGLRCVYKP